MSLKYFFPSFLVLLVVILLGVKNYEIWNYPFELSEENGLTRKQGKDPEAARITMGSQKDPVSIASYVFIAEKNIFNPERKDFPVRPVETSKQNVRPQVILYGVSIAEDYQAASIINPGRALRKGERETMTLKVGEKVGEYKLAKIQPDRITMESNGDSFEVLLYDSRNPKKRIEVKTEVKPPTVTSTQPAPAPTTSPVPQAAPPATAAAPPSASIEKPKEPPQQQQVVPPIPAPTPRPIPSRWERSQLRRGGIPAYPPTSPSPGTPGQGTGGN